MSPAQGPCLLYPQKQTCAAQLGMSAMGHKRTFLPVMCNKECQHHSEVGSRLVISIIPRDTDDLVHCSILEARHNDFDENAVLRDRELPRKLVYHRSR